MLRCCIEVNIIFQFLWHWILFDNGTSAIFTRGDNFFDFLFVYLTINCPKMGSTLEGKNLLLLQRETKLNGRVASPENVHIQHERF